MGSAKRRRVFLLAFHPCPQNNVRFGLKDARGGENVALVKRIVFQTEMI